MKQLVFLLLLLLNLNTLLCQSNHSNYSFDVKIQGSGSPIIFIPGLACSGEVWTEMVAAFEKEHQCHILTLAGFSTQAAINLDNGFSPVVQSEIVKYIKDELTEKPIIIGHSLGGFLSLSIASSFPDLIERIVIVDSYPFYSAAMNPYATAENIQPQAALMKNSIISMPDSLFLQQQNMLMKTMMRDTDKIKMAVQWSLESDKHTVAQAMYELMTTDLRTNVEMVTCPILVLGSWYGAKDYGITKEMVAANYKNQFAKAANCTIHIADKAKHFVMWDAPDWSNEKTGVFLTE